MDRLETEADYGAGDTHTHNVFDEYYGLTLNNITTNPFASNYGCCHICMMTRYIC